MKNYYFIFLFLQYFITYSQCTPGPVSVEINENGRINSCLTQVISSVNVNTLLGDDYKINVKIVKNNSTTITSRSFKPTEFTSLNNGIYKYSLPPINTNNHPDASTFKISVMTLRIKKTPLVPIAYPISVCTKEVYKCLNDHDNDGIPNAEDNCPNEIGIPENDGCPGLPDLDIKYIKVTNNTTGEEVYNSTNDKNNSSPVLVRRLNNYTIKFAVENNGTLSSGKCFLGAFLSNDSNLNEDNDCYINEGSINGLNVGNYYETSIPIYVNYDGTFCSEFRTLTNNKSYYLIFSIDIDKKIAESNENNNLHGLVIKYSSAQSSKVPTPIKPILEREISNSYPINIEVYDLSGNKISSKLVKDKNEEDYIINNIPSKGFYLIKKGNENIKIYKDN